MATTTCYFLTFEVPSVVNDLYHSKKWKNNDCEIWGPKLPINFFKTASGKYDYNGKFATTRCHFLTPDLHVDLLSSICNI